ncbi:MAG: hypothetical protein JSV80_06140, partial [Acidobacteriota bacterium]
ARFFSTRHPFVHQDERRQAYASLAYYPDDARARWVEQGLRSRDDQIKSICDRLRAESAASEAEERAVLEKR